MKLFHPDRDVVIFGGDGDIVGIGLSHFIHGARRNLDVLVIMVNNMVYGMTGGQVAPTTPLQGHAILRVGQQPTQKNLKSQLKKPYK